MTTPLQPPPRKKPRSKLKKINVTERAKWKLILKDVEKREIPITMLLSIGVNLIDGTVVEIDIKELLLAGNDPDEIEDMLDAILKALDDIINDVDFFISIEDVAKAVQPLTDNLLKGL